ncbi:IF-2B-domain-containing protein [Hyaloscypha bicolor E]|uniref:Translation initiation factor eIF2B subunit delta n=1 Tax=Hyaloscypha bicolor E TaxID=1095630 RepID=A0A2J6T8B7_9HELO|nr:IF-2B-domain-containing protein [Hyaloscypha bicolor E]PMD59260.1 IF-2B-domain-containing protein [Hyaloscypha bicolor E]
MPSSDPPTAESAPPQAPSPAQGKGNTAKQPKGKEPAAPTDGPKLSGAELKKRAKEEKAARRAEALLAKGAAVPVVPLTPGQQPKAEGQKGAKGQRQHQRGGSTSVELRNLPVRGAQKVVPGPIATEPKKEDKTVEFFRHLYKTRTTSIAGASKDVHPAVLALGLQMSNYTICGSCARLVATLQAFKRVIESYTTPPQNSLSRHLTSHVLSPQIEYLSSCRPLSISMGNAIRWLKLEVSKVDVSVPDAEAKKGLCDAIDVFIRERVTFADQVIARSAADKIKNGDVIMTYAKSSIVQRALVTAHEEGKKFRVIIVDSRPLHEGKHLAAALVKIGMDVKYCLINGLSHNIQDVTKVLLGAHAMMSNGRLFSRIGTALVAMEANEADKPVIVLCETIKFTERVALDSIVHNEIAPSDELVIPGGPLENWGDIKKLQLCNPMYDVTPADYIQMIVTESGNVPPTSVPVLHRLGNESQG